MMNKEKKISNVLGMIGGKLFLALLVLKIFNVITWSWWWVCAPLWIPLAIVLVICGIYVIKHRSLFF